MNDAAFDPEQLTESQQTALATYTSVTDQDAAQAAALLRRSEWNVQIAIAKFFDGEDAQAGEDASLVNDAHNQAAPAPSRASSEPHRETLLNGSHSFPRPPRPDARQPAPRIVPQTQSQSNILPPFFIQILLAPFQLGTKVVGGLLALISYTLSNVFRYLPGVRIRNPSPRIRSGRRPLSPRDTAARFAREFEEDYGSHDLHFFEGGYAAAYDLAKKELKFLLVVILSPEHDDTVDFVRDTLLSPETTSYINGIQDLILWAGSIQDSEAYQVSTGLNCSKLPFAALICHTPQDSSTAMSTVARMSGLTPPNVFTSQLRKAIDQQTPHLSRVRGQRQEQQASRSLREEQNTAYERSLAQDRERARQRREAEAAQARAAEEARARAEAEQKQVQKKEQWRQWRAQNLRPEPGPDVKETSRVSIRLRDGQRLIRKFAADSDMEELYAFVDCASAGDANGASVSQPNDYQHTFDFRLVSPMPRVVYDLDASGTIGGKIGRSANLIVESILPEDDENS